MSVFSAGLMEGIEVLRRWKNLKTIVKVEAHTVHVPDRGRETTQTRYYISDEDFPSAAYYRGLARDYSSSSKKSEKFISSLRYEISGRRP